MAKRTRLVIGRAFDHDPVPFECPCGSCEYDCQKRTPVRAACACKRLLCRKCAGVTASLPDPGPCGLCGAASVSPFEDKEFHVDRGVLLALAGRLAPVQPYVCLYVCVMIACPDGDRVCLSEWCTRVGVCRPPPCGDCARDGESTPAEYTCCEAKCDLKALCDAHIIAHKRWGHSVSVLVPDDDAAGAPTPDVLRGVTHCAVPDHAGAEGVLTHVCKPCGGALVCRVCIDGHLGGGHDLCRMDVAAEVASASIAAGLPVLREGLAHQVSLAASYREQLEVLASRRGVAVEALGAATARLHAAVDAKHAAMLGDIQAAYDTKVAAVQVGLAAARAAAAELATVAATAEAGVEVAASAVMRVHVAVSVAASLELAQCRAGLDADVVTLGFEGLTEEEVGAGVRLGRVVTGTEAAAGGPSASQVCLRGREVRRKYEWCVEDLWPWAPGKSGVAGLCFHMHLTSFALSPLYLCRPARHLCPGVWP